MPDGCWRRARQQSFPAVTILTSESCCARRDGRPNGSTCCCRGVARHESVLRSALERGARTSAGLSRQSRACQRHGAGAGPSGQPAAGDFLAQPAGDARRTTGPRQHCADGAGPRAARAVLSAAAGARPTVACLVRGWLFRIWIPSRGAGAGALFHAAGAAQHHHRPAGRRACDPRGRAGRRHDGASVAIVSGVAAGAAGDDGGHPHRGGVGDRHRDAVDPDRTDQPRQLHLCGAADSELGVRAVRLPRRRGAGARGRSIAGPDRDRPSPAQPPRAAELSASSREGLGSNVIFDALASGDIDVYVDYSGTLWANQFHHSDIKPREELLDELKATLATQKITLLGELGFENAYALVMPRKRAEELGIHSIADLASHAPAMSMAADYEFFSRPEWAGLREAYGLSLRAQRQMQPDFMYAAVASGEVDVIAGYTSDGLIAKYDLVVLDDAKHAIPPYDAIVLLAPKRASDQALRAALSPLLGQIDIATMREANLRAAGGDGVSSPDAVARWLWEKIGKR